MECEIACTLTVIDADAQPALCEAHVIDRHGRVHVIADKEPIFRAHDHATPVIRGIVLERGNDYYRVSIAAPWGLETQAGLTVLEIAADRARLVD